MELVVFVLAMVAIYLIIGTIHAVVVSRRMSGKFRWRLFFELWKVRFGLPRKSQVVGYMEKLDDDEPAPEPQRVMPRAVWIPRTDMVTDVRTVAIEGAREYVSDMDTDGTVVMVQQLNTGVQGQYGARILTVSPQGVKEVIAEGGDLSSSLVQGVSIQNGSMAWWQLPPDGANAYLYRKDPGAEPRVIAHEAITQGQVGYRITATPLVMGAHTAWTIVRGTEGYVGVTLADGTSNRLTSTRVQYLCRDVVAEAEGRQVAAVTVVPKSEVPSFQVWQLSVDQDGPHLTRVRRGMVRGATLAGGEVVGCRESTGVFEFPGGISMPAEAFGPAYEVVADREWAVYSSFEGFIDDYMHMHCLLFHLPTGYMQRLTEFSAHRTEIRGEYVMWHERRRIDISVPREENGQTTLVARLRPPLHATASR